MNDELKRFLNSIGYVGNLIDTEITKVILNKKLESFDVYLKSKQVLPIESINGLFSAAKNGINFSNKCNIDLTYENIDEEKLKEYLKYFLEELIIIHPSLINLKNR